VAAARLGFSSRLCRARVCGARGAFGRGQRRRLRRRVRLKLLVLRGMARCQRS